MKGKVRVLQVEEFPDPEQVKTRHEPQKWQVAAPCERKSTEKHANRREKRHGTTEEGRKKNRDRAQGKNPQKNE